MIFHMIVANNTENSIENNNSLFYWSLTKCMLCFHFLKEHMGEQLYSIYKSIDQQLNR